MAQLYSTGPVSVYCGIGSGGTPLFLGHGQRAPKISITAEFRDVECDLGGAVSFDTMYGGERGRVSVLLSRYNETVLTIIQDKAIAAAGAVRGTDDPGEIGSLMVSEGLTYGLWLNFPYNTKAFNSNAANGAIPAGYHFFAAYLRGPDDIEVGSTTPKMVQCNFDCLRTFNPAISNAFGQGRLALYDHVMGVLPVID